MRTDGIGPVNLKVVPNECCLGRSPWTRSYTPLFPTPTIGMKWACSKYSTGVYNPMDQILCASPIPTIGTENMWDTDKYMYTYSIIIRARDKT